MCVYMTERKRESEWEWEEHKSVCVCVCVCVHDGQVEAGVWWICGKGLDSPAERKPLCSLVSLLAGSGGSSFCWSLRIKKKTTETAYQLFAPSSSHKHRIFPNY